MRLEPVGLDAVRHTPAPESSRGATDRLLGDLRTRRWRPAGWARFAAEASVRSVEQAAAHPHALG